MAQESKATIVCDNCKKIQFQDKFMGYQFVGEITCDCYVNGKLSQVTALYTSDAIRVKHYCSWECLKIAISTNLPEQEKRRIDND